VRRPWSSCHREQDQLTTLAAECERAIGRAPAEVPTEGTTLLLAFWLDDDASKLKIIEDHLVERGFVTVKPDVPAFALFQREARTRNMGFDGPPTHLWRWSLTEKDDGFRDRRLKRSTVCCVSFGGRSGI
jgi:hypothetical protein